MQIRKRSEMLSAMLQAQEKERNRLATDLHDGLGARISALRLLSSSLLNRLDSSLQLKGTELLKGIEEVQQEVRSISHDLVPRDLEHYGLLYELDKMQYRAETLHRIAFRLHTSLSEEQISLPVELNIYRIIQELFQNTIKHSGASEVELHLNNSEKGLEIFYRDNGKGISEEKSIEGIGLRNLRARASLMQAEVQMKEDRGAGFEMRLLIPSFALKP
jgi:signal transduction histidine kinase